jgi:hypothetical protein
MVPETCTRMRSPAMASKARPRQGRVGSSSSCSSTSRARKPAMSPTSRDSISTGSTASSGPGAGELSGHATPISPPTANTRIFQADVASAGVGFVGPMAPQAAVSQTTQQEPWTVWLTATSVLPQNGHGSSVLITYPCGTKPDSHLSSNAYAMHVVPPAGGHGPMLTGCAPENRRDRGAARR